MKIEYYRFEDGTSPIDEYLEDLDVRMRVKVLRAIMLLKANGANLREPHSKSMGDGIFELRAQVGVHIERVMYFFFEGDKAVLTNGFTKKQQKTPMNEIRLAKQRRADYLRRF